jgi:hypothetical protein
MRDEDLRAALASWLQSARDVRPPDLTVIRRRLRRRRTRVAAASVVALAVVASLTSGIRLTAGRSSPATARPADTAAIQSGTSACTSMHVFWSDQVADTMQGAVYALVFRNTAARLCVIEGWPKVTVRGPAFLTSLHAIDAAAGDGGPIEATRVTLRPGADAAATVQIGSPVNAANCAAPTWSVTPPGGRGITILPEAPAPAGHQQPAGPTGLCADDSIEVSPVYPGDQPQTGPYPPPPGPTTSPFYPQAASPEPPACAATALRARVTDTETSQDGSFVVLRLSVSGHRCTLRRAIATVRLHEADGADPMGKIFSTPQSVSASRSVLVTYGSTAAAPVALPLSERTSAAVALLLPLASAPACRRLTSVTIYPGSVGLGPGLIVGIGGALQVCGTPLVLGFLSASPAGVAVATARQALQAAARKGL